MRSERPAGEGEARHPSSARRWLWSLRVTTAVSLLGALLLLASPAAVGELLQGSIEHWELLAIAAVQPLFSVGLALLRWQLLLGRARSGPSFGRLLSGYFVGLFYNQFLPSTIGGDVARAWWVGREVGRMRRSLAIVAVDRGIGLIGTLCVGAVAVLFHPSLLDVLPSLWAAIALVLLGFAALWFVGNARLQDRVGSMLAGRGPALVHRAASVARDAGASLQEAPLRAVWAVACSVGIQLNLVLHYFLLAKALGIGIPLLDLAVLIPVVTLISLIPVTINGIGLREGALVALGAPLGVDPAEAVALGALYLALLLPYAIAGGVLAGVGRGRAAPRGLQPLLPGEERVPSTRS